ncbi:MAG: hypothetical protein E6I58_04485 [Chloroflexi bacterium]|nr:MAG: hypothetical protein E6J05_03955 [Chloroflexota bacterium]TME57818.1 MAG: hypothetical protein E6I58_04485 [Chloroflexota bacterium]
MTAVTAIAAVSAWAGAAALVLADGRRGLAVGVALVTFGFTALAWADGAWLEGSFLLAGGALCTVELIRRGPPDWGLMPPGSTPRLILAAVAGILALWFAASVTTGPDAPLRFACVAVLGLAAGRVLQGHAAASVLSASAALAIALASASALALSDPGFAPYLIGGMIAGGALFLPVAEPRGA